MYEQGYLTLAEYQADSADVAAAAADVESPSEEDDQTRATGYFVELGRAASCSRTRRGFQNLVYSGRLPHPHDARRAASRRRRRASSTTSCRPTPGGPAAALVAIDNATGEVRAMVGGYNYNTDAFNLATQAERQPGSAWKVFDLAVALEAGYSPNHGRTSAPFTEHATRRPCYRPFTVHNDEAQLLLRARSRSRRRSRVSDNSVFARVGSTRRRNRGVAHDRRARATTSASRPTISLNPSMVIGGLHMGVTPLDMAHAYETIADGGNADQRQPLASRRLRRRRAIGHLRRRRLRSSSAAPAAGCPGPVGITLVSAPARATIYAVEPAASTHLRPRLHAYRRLEEIAMMRAVVDRSARRAGAGDPRRRRLGQDRHDLQLHRRLVRRLDAADAGTVPVDDGRGLGRLPQQRQVDGARLRRQAGLRRHLSGADLARLRRQTRSGPSSPPAPASTDALAADRSERALIRHDGDDERRRAAPPHGRADAPATGATATAARHRRRRPARRRARPTGTAQRRRQRAAAARHDARTTSPRTTPPRRHRTAPGGGVTAPAAERRRARLRERRPARRETKRLPATLKRHGSSTALVIPIRREADDARRRRALAARS